ncbi:hypothetical protein ATK74_0836 [Propionicimonas paludicola]|uniref:Uncharacterized protein n=1 Tax=Propionicimonas paludicola TaxID=185243 RepID=A0A2A9CRR6_9ACTN|nr:hypothetical protein [Propionicimonas paludicola]PFG16302.1 hypothetical protein ATK74_0836 [Propionicimonas paludicola]
MTIPEPRSTHVVRRGAAETPCWCAAPRDHLIGEEILTPAQIAARAITNVGWTLDPGGFRIATAHAAQAVIETAAAVTNRIRARHSAGHWCIDAEGRPDMFHPDRSLGFNWPCPELEYLGQIDAEFGVLR